MTPGSPPGGSGIIPALTLHQPWATLIALGLKRFETRDWAASRYRGPIAIHAGKHRDLDDEADLLHDLECLHGHPDLPAAEDLPRGAVVAIGRLVGCRLMTGELIGQQHRLERRVGFWSAGRWAWEISEVVALPTPAPARGYQGLWRWTPEPNLFEAASR